MKDRIRLCLFLMMVFLFVFGANIRVSAEDDPTGDEERTVYVLTDTLIPGENYLIVSSNMVSGTDRARALNYHSRDPITIRESIPETGDAVYVSAEDVMEDSVWTIKLNEFYSQALSIDIYSIFTTYGNMTYYLRWSPNGIDFDTTSQTLWEWDPEEHCILTSGRRIRYSSFNETFNLGVSDAVTYLYRETVIRPHTHSYGAPVYTWDLENGTCTASMTCSKCEEGAAGHTITETVHASADITLDATCTAAGVRTWTSENSTALLIMSPRPSSMTPSSSVVSIMVTSS